MRMSPTEKADREDRMVALVASMWAGVSGCAGVWWLFKLPPPESVIDLLPYVSIGLGTLALVVGFGYTAYASLRTGW